MSLRRVPRTVDELVAYMDERFRQLDAGNRVAPTDTRYLYDARGDILVARGPDDPEALHTPFSSPPGPGMYVLRSKPSASLGVEWTFVNGLTGGSSGGSSGGGGVTDHGALTGLGDDDHPQYTTSAEATTLADASVATHVAAGDPHPTYLTAAEGNAAYEATGAVATHAAAGDPHTGYQRESEKGAASGYASLGADTLVPQAQLGSGAQDGTKFLRDDGTWQTVSGGGSASFATLSKWGR